MTLLGRDFKARVAARFAGRLKPVTFSRVVSTGVNPADPSGPPSSSGAVDYAAQGASFGYTARQIDGEAIKLGDYQVTVLLGTVLDEDEDPADVAPDVGDLITCTPPGLDSPKTGRVLSVPVRTEAFVTCQVRGEGY